SVSAAVRSARSSKAARGTRFAWSQPKTGSVSMASLPTDRAAPAPARRARVGAAITASQLYRSVFRHDWTDSARNRALEITSNAFLHLHPITIPRHAIRVCYTFCLGGLT